MQGLKEALKGVGMKSEKKSERTLSPEKQGLSKAAQELLSRVRASPNPEVVYGLPLAAAEAKAHSVIDPLIEDTGLPVARLNQYRWYLAELCRLMRTRSGPDLAYCMEYTLKKWLSFGLEPNSVVVLASELFERLRPQAETEGNSPPRHQDTKGSDRGEAAKPASPKSEARMTIETRSPNAPHPDPLLSEERGSGATVRREQGKEAGRTLADDGRRTSDEPPSGGGGP
jgi:hypothetical protein